MRKSKKIIILIAILIVILIVAVTTTIIIVNKKFLANGSNLNENKELILYDTALSDYVKETENGIKINTSIQLNQEKKIGDLTVTGIQLTNKGGVTTLIGVVTNNTSVNTNLQNIEVIFLGENGEELATAKGIVGALKEGESTKINISMSGNYINAYDLKFIAK